MKALAIRQPYASLIMSGVKNIENRSWATHHRGPLAIYASKAITAADVKEEREFCAENGLAFPEELPTGVILGVVDLAGIFQPSQTPGLQFDFVQKGDKARVKFPLDLSWYEDGAIGWVLQNPRPIQLVRFSGRLGLFEIPDELIKVP